MYASPLGMHTCPGLMGTQVAEIPRMRARDIELPIGPVRAGKGAFQHKQSAEFNVEIAKLIGAFGCHTRTMGGAILASEFAIRILVEGHDAVEHLARVR